VTAARLVIGLSFQFRLFVIDRFVQLLIFMVSLLGELLDLTGFDSTDDNFFSIKENTETYWSRGFGHGCSNQTCSIYKRTFQCFL
jgi:hypothetical protein